MKIWKLIGKHQGPLGTTIIYGAEDCVYEIQSRKRHIPHANGSGTWDHTSYFVIQNGQEVKELQRLQAAKDYVDRLEAGA